MPADVGAAFNKGKRLGLLAWLATMAMIALCSTARSADLVLPDLLVDTQWLETKLGHPSLVVVDARAPTDYAAGHIEGAVSLPYTETFASNSDYKLIVSLSRARALFSTAGVARDKVIVIYDGGEGTHASRVFWVLEAYGHRRAAILDGGFPHWRAQGLPHSIVPAVPVPSTFVPEPQVDRLAGKLATRLALANPNIVLIDSRSEDEFFGSTSKAALAGRIPQSVNVPWLRNVTRMGDVTRYKSSEELREVYAFVAGRKAIAYCNSGKDATLTYFVLRRLGMNPAVYDGSWLEWSVDAQTPKVLAGTIAP